MPRRSRFADGNYIYHVLNRGVARRQLFFNELDYAAFLNVMQEAIAQVDVRILSYCLMPNHWHLVLWPRENGDLSNYMQWLTSTHSQRWHVAHGSVGTGSVYQGRFKSFPVQCDDHFYSVCRYVERNPVRAKLVQFAQDWRWSSLWQITNECFQVSLHPWPVPRSKGWIEHVNQVMNEKELSSIRRCATRGTPYGDSHWQQPTAERLGLLSTLRNSGRPKKVK